MPFKSPFEPLEGSIFIPETSVQDGEMVGRNVPELRSLAQLVEDLYRFFPLVRSSVSKSEKG